MEYLFVKVFRFILEYGVVQFLLGSFVFSIIRAVYKFFTNREIYNDVIRSGRVKSILLRLGETKALLNCSEILITHIHNGAKWINGRHIYKLSIYKTLSLYSRNNIETALSDIKLSEISEIIEKLNGRNFDIISVSELPNDFPFKRILKRDKISYIVLFKIQKNSQALGYIWVIFAEGKEVTHDREVYSELQFLCDEIAEELK